MNLQCVAQVLCFDWGVEIQNVNSPDTDLTQFLNITAYEKFQKISEMIQFSENRGLKSEVVSILPCKCKNTIFEFCHALVMLENVGILIRQGFLALECTRSYVQVITWLFMYQQHMCHKSSYINPFSPSVIIIVAVYQPQL